MDKARKMHLEGYNPYAVAQRLQELEEVGNRRGRTRIMRRNRARRQGSTETLEGA